MKKLLSGFISVAFVLMPFATALPVQAAALPNWDITGTWTFDDIYGGDNFHTMTITSFDQSTGAFSGTGFYIADPSLTWTITGTESGNDITYLLTVLTPPSVAGVTLNGTGTINSSGTIMSGTGSQSNLPGGGPVTWTATGVAIPICRAPAAPSIAADHLKSHEIKASSAVGKNAISQVANHMTQDAKFDNESKCSSDGYTPNPDYVIAVINFLHAIPGII
jgi:hypothetical protein